MDRDFPRFITLDTDSTSTTRKMADAGIFYLILGALICYTGAETCTNPQVTSQSYTTTDGTVVANIAFIAEFTVVCENKLQGLNLFADIGGKLIPVTKAQEGNKYQISWTDDIKKVSYGDYPVKIYDDEGFAALRKAQRSGEDTSILKSLFTVVVTHAGTYNGPWVQSELMAALISLSVWYLAYSTKSKIQA